MKNSKFWIWFIPLFLIVLVGIYFMLKKNEVNTPVNNNDENNIKEEYKKGNNEFFAVNLSNAHVYKTVNNDELKEIFEKKDGLVFIGDTNDNIARKNLVVLNDVVSSTSVPQVYYIHKKDVNNELINYINDKTNLFDIKVGTLISIESGKVLKVFYPAYILDNKELSDIEKETLFNEYKTIVNKFIEECDENC